MNCSGVVRAVRMSPLGWSGPLQATVGGFLVLIAWDLAGFDLGLARLFGGNDGFARRDDPWFAKVMHDAIKPVPWLVTLALFVIVFHRKAKAVEPSLARRLQWPLTTLMCAATIGVLKASSATSCPWDLQEFGGVARFMSHWRGWFESDYGPGRCFPAGHATNGFSFIGGWFVLRRSHTRAANAVLVGSLVIGLTFGLTQQIRGAHFMSHTLWTAWICWSLSLVIDRLLPRLGRA